MTDTSSLPLCVDLDGTLVKTDTLAEQLLLLCKQHPVAVLQLLWWLTRGTVFCKQQLAQKVVLPVAHLPYHQELLEYLREQHKTGRVLVLATASHKLVARAVVDHLGIFSRVVATATINLSGAHKAEHLVALFGQRGFVYAGNSRVDYPVWQAAAAGLVVNASTTVARQASQLVAIEKKFPRERWSLLTLIGLLRSQQWVKNILVVVPLIAAHQVTNFSSLLATLITFIAFSLIASSVYIVNDLLDLFADRQHPTKQFRPLAAGQVSLEVGAMLAPLLASSALILGWYVAPAVAAWLVVYLLVATTYTWWLKRLIAVDVIVLAFLYVIRLFAGGAATGIQLSRWLLVFSLFIFISLALIKRFSELKRIADQAGNHSVGRGYTIADLAPVGQLGVVSGYVAVMVLALYVSSPEVVMLYHTPRLLWLLLPLFLYWVSRLWIIAYRGGLQGRFRDEPLVFAMRDVVSYLVAAIGLLIIFIAA